jgi:1-acyl-sn-glycerol-3-phosphate acyltransferase
VAPHTSNWDFILGKLAYASVGRKTGFLMKETWFFPPLGWIFKAIGGIPVPRKRGSSLSQVIVDKFKSAERMQLAVTPEGTRSRVSEWRHGFLYIARDANVPIVLGVLDAATKTMTIDKTFLPVGDIEADMKAIKQYYRATGAQGIKPHNFTTD